MAENKHRLRLIRLHNLRPETCLPRTQQFLYLFIYLFLAALGLRCCTWAFSSCGERGLHFIAVRGLLMAVASLVAELGL